MTTEYSLDVHQRLEERFYKSRLFRPMRISRYEPGKKLTFEVTGLVGSRVATAHILIEKFVGGGFAGQVYRIKLLALEGGEIPGLMVGKSYAMKILVPPSRASEVFRNVLYGVGFQGPFQLQVNPAAGRAGALWQKFIRRAAKVHFGDEGYVVDIHATFVDKNIGSCGELSEWVEGRTWRLEADDRLDLLKQWSRGKPVDEKNLGSPEFRTKKVFMKDFVEMLHEIGAHEFARQYEWSTCKSQPNCLKRKEAEDDPTRGLVAVDFRAGLALLPFLPMSPGDFKLVLNGLARGSLVQFDRGDLKKLEHYVHTHEDEFLDMLPQLDELKTNEEIYRNSVPDIAHNHVRLLYSKKLWGTILERGRTGWKVRNIIDDEFDQVLKQSRLKTILFALLGFVPFLGGLIRRIWGHEAWRKHYQTMLTSRNYLGRAFRARLAEKLIGWHRAGRVSGERALKLMDQPWRLCWHVPLSLLPAFLHRSMTDFAYLKGRLATMLVRPVQLYFNPAMREAWLSDMVSDGQKNHLISEEDAQEIMAQVKEPFIQKYLKSLAVHVCMFPVTHVVAFGLAIYFVVTHPDMPREQAWGIALGIVAFFQVIPISPGSIARGLYVVYLVIRERNFKDYKIAVFLAFFKYIGYLAFPIQMAHHYPALARFMAAHWAAEIVRMVPVFGERGALLEHKVYSLFYNWPLTIRSRLKRRAEHRALRSPRYWHVPLCVVVGVAGIGAIDYVYLQGGRLPLLKEAWMFVVPVPVVCAVLVTLGAGGAKFGKRVISAIVCTTAMVTVESLLVFLIGHLSIIHATVAPNEILIRGLWEIFIFALLSTVAVMQTELMLPDVDRAGAKSGNEGPPSSTTRMNVAIPVRPGTSEVSPLGLSDDDVIGSPSDSNRCLVKGGADGGL